MLLNSIFTLVLTLIFMVTPMLALNLEKFSTTTLNVISLLVVLNFVTLFVLGVIFIWV